MAASPPRSLPRLRQRSQLEAEEPLEATLMASFQAMKPHLSPPFKATTQTLMDPQSQQYTTLTQALLFAILTHPNSGQTHVTHLKLTVTDAYASLVHLLTSLVITSSSFASLYHQTKSQIIWLFRQLVELKGHHTKALALALLRRVNDKDSAWLAIELLDIFQSNWAWFQGNKDLLLSGLFSYLRLLSDHSRIKANSHPNFQILKANETVLCVRIIRECFCDCMFIGRDLVRLLKDIHGVAEIEGILKDLYLNPGVFGVSEFTDVSQLYLSRTPSRFTLLRVTPEMEIQLRFLLTHVRWGNQRRYLQWFASKFLGSPESEYLIPDIVRFICCAHHPTNEILQSDIIARWAVVGWLLKCCRSKRVEVSANLALFYDWLFFNPAVDNIMNIEPGILLMVHSLPNYAGITQSLLEFLFNLVDNYDPQRRAIVQQGVVSSLEILLKKGVVMCLDPLLLCTQIAPALRNRLAELVKLVGIKSQDNVDLQHGHQGVEKRALHANSRVSIQTRPLDNSHAVSDTTSPRNPFLQHGPQGFEKINLLANPSVSTLTLPINNSYTVSDTTSPVNSVLLHGPPGVERRTLHANSMVSTHTAPIVTSHTAADTTNPSYSALQYDPQEIEKRALHANSRVPIHTSAIHDSHAVSDTVSPSNHLLHHGPQGIEKRALNANSRVPTHTSAINNSHTVSDRTSPVNSVLQHGPQSVEKRNLRSNSREPIHTAAMNNSHTVSDMTNPVNSVLQHGYQAVENKALHATSREPIHIPAINNSHTVTDATSPHNTGEMLGLNNSPTMLNSFSNKTSLGDIIKFSDSNNSQTVFSAFSDRRSLSDPTKLSTLSNSQPVSNALSDKPSPSIPTKLSALNSSQRVIQSLCDRINEGSPMNLSPSNNSQTLLHTLSDRASPFDPLQNSVSNNSQQVLHDKLQSRSSANATIDVVSQKTTQIDMSQQSKRLGSQKPSQIDALLQSKRRRLEAPNATELNKLLDTLKNSKENDVVAVEMLEKFLASFLGISHDLLDNGNTLGTGDYPDVMNYSLKESTKNIAKQIASALEVGGKKMFSPPGSNSVSLEADEVNSVSSLVLCVFSLFPHKKIQTMLLVWSMIGFPVGPRLLCYAGRLADELERLSAFEIMNNHSSECATVSLEDFGVLTRDRKVEHSSVKDASTQKVIDGDSLDQSLLKWHFKKHRAYVDSKDSNAVQQCKKIGMEELSAMVRNVFIAYREFLVASNGGLSGFQKVSNNKSKIPGSGITVGCAVEDESGLNGELYHIFLDHLRTCCLWSIPKSYELFSSIFHYLPDFSVGKKSVIELLVNFLIPAEVFKFENRLMLQKISVFGEDPKILCGLVKVSFNWDYIEQQLFWRLLSSDVQTHKVSTIKPLLKFCSENFDPTVHGGAISGLMTFLRGQSPSVELTEVILCLPEKLTDFGVCIFVSWCISHHSNMATCVKEWIEDFATILQNGYSNCFGNSSNNVNMSVIRIILSILEKQHLDWKPAVSEITICLKELENIITLEKR